MKEGPITLVLAPTAAWICGTASAANLTANPSARGLSECGFIYAPPIAGPGPASSPAIARQRLTAGEEPFSIEEPDSAIARQNRSARGLAARRRGNQVFSGHMTSRPATSPRAVTASLIGRVCQAVELLLSMFSAVPGRLGVSHASLRSRLDLDRRCTHWPDGAGSHAFGRARCAAAFAASPGPSFTPRRSDFSIELLWSVDAHACVGAGPERNCDPSIHMRCRITASLRATAMTARR